MTMSERVYVVNLFWKHIICCLLMCLFSTASGSSEPSFFAPLQNITVTAGREARIPCVVENLQNFKVAWVHYGDRGSAVLSVGTHVLTTNRRVTVVSERETWTLVIANATVADRGEYMCQISTVPPQKMYASLQVLVPPQITHPPMDITVNEGDNATLECGASGDPKPNITWRKEGETAPTYKDELSDGGDGANLNLISVSREMAGAILCVASNGVPPAVSGRAILYVNYRPTVIGSQESVTWAVVGGQTHLKCRFDSFPRPQIAWSYRGHPIPSGIKVETKFTGGSHVVSKLIIVHASPSDFGPFKCEAKNAIGRASITYQLMEQITTTTTSTTSTTTTSTPTSTPTSSKDTLTLTPLTASVRNSNSLRVDLGVINRTKQQQLLESTLRGNQDEDVFFLVDGINPKDRIPPEVESTNKELKASSLNRFIQESPLEKLFEFVSFSNEGPNLHFPLKQLLNLVLTSAISFLIRSYLLTLSFSYH